MRANIHRFSRTVRMPYPLDSPPETMLIRGRSSCCWVVTSSPSTQARPDVGARSVVRILMRVVLPAPFGPSKPNNSPGRTSRFTRSSARNSAGVSSGFVRNQPRRRLRRYVRDRSSVRMANSVIMKQCTGPVQQSLHPTPDRPMLPAHRLLQDLVRIPSVNPMGRAVTGDQFYEHRVTDYLEEFFRDLGVAYDRRPVAPLRDNIVARY